MSCSRSLQLHREKLKRLARERRVKKKKLRKVERELSAFVAFPRPAEQNRLQYLGAYTQGEAFVPPRDHDKPKARKRGRRHRKQHGDDQQGQRQQSSNDDLARRGVQEAGEHAQPLAGEYDTSRADLSSNGGAPVRSENAALPVASPPTMANPIHQRLPETPNAWASPWRAGHTREGDDFGRPARIFLEGTTAGLPCPPSSPITCVN